MKCVIIAATIALIVLASSKLFFSDSPKIMINSIATNINDNDMLIEYIENAVENANDAFYLQLTKEMIKEFEDSGKVIYLKYSQPKKYIPAF